MPKVLNKATATKEDLVNSIYVGRPTFWGNKYVIGKDGTREEVVRKYKEHLDRVYSTKEIKEKLKELKGKNLVCHCAPKACHADVLLEYANKDNT